MAVAITAQELNLFPPPVLVSVTGLTIGDDIILYRSVGGVRTAVRAGSATDVADSSFLRVDGELPYGIPVTYIAVVNSTTEYSTSATTYTLPGGKVVFSDAITGASAEAVILAWDEKVYDNQSTVFKAGGRNVVVSGEMGMFEASITVFFEAYSSGQQFDTLMRTATEGVIQLRGPDPKYNGVDCYLVVVGAREQRFSQDGSDERRTWVIDVAQTESWSADREAVGFTWADVIDTYDGLTWADFYGDYATWLAAAQGDFS